MRPRLQIEDLTDEQYRYFIRNIWNGVGSEELALKPPALCFGPASIEHDFDGWVGGNEEERLWSNDKFHKNCDAACDSTGTPDFWSELYYWGLNKFGRIGWEYREVPIQTWNELVKAVEQHRRQASCAKKMRKYLMRSYRGRR